ncbi:MAG: hypothetical protein HYX78_04710 [Armatimonadetes bacterium]|nr:hypothetical protein [Armatimonadota bacterium]
MPTFNLRRFSQPDTLKAVSVQNLTRFLYPHAHYFSNRGFTIPSPETEADGFDYDALAAILITPDDHVPSDLVEVLHLVNEMSTPEAMDELLREADVEGIVIDGRPDPTPTDVAIQVYFQNPRLLESKHSEQLLTRARTFQYFQAKDDENTDLAPPSEDVIRALETDLDNWFVEHNRGRGSRVFHYVREDGMWFLVRHGEPCKREGSMVDGEPGCVYYRPGKHDVLIYQPATGEIGINAGTRGEVDLYKRMLGLHLFGNEDFFPGDGKYTLKPLRDSGADSLVCSDIEGIEWIKLKELQFFWGGPYKEIEIWKADDIFAMLADKERKIPSGVPILKAGFHVKFEDAKNPRTVSIRPSNVAQFSRDDDGELVEAWLKKREFIITPEGKEDEDEP